MVRNIATFFGHRLLTRNRTKHFEVPGLQSDAHVIPEVCVAPSIVNGQYELSVVSGLNLNGFVVGFVDLSDRRSKPLFLELGCQSHLSLHQRAVLPNGETLAQGPVCVNPIGMIPTYAGTHWLASREMSEDEQRRFAEAVQNELISFNAKHIR